MNREEQHPVQPPVRRYAYGLHWAGLDQVTDLMPATATDLMPATATDLMPAGAATSGPGGSTAQPVVRVRLTDGTPAPPPVPIDSDHGTWTFADGRSVAIDRRTGTATFYGPAPTPDLLAHPCLAPVATAFNRWAGRESFHAGAFVADDRAWILLGGRTAGKSSLLAALAARGIPVLADDVVMVDPAGVRAGPRCVDLRQAVPHTALTTRPVRDGTRLRLPLPAITDPCPLGGWIFLRWRDSWRDPTGPTADQTPRLVPVGAGDLLGRLAIRRTWPGLSTDPTMLLALAAQPAWELVRARDWTELNRTCELLESLPGTVTAGYCGASR